MERGKRTPEPVKEFILETKENAPGLTNYQIAERVLAEFHFEIDKSTVGRFINEAGLRSSTGVRQKEPSRIWGRHRDDLVSPLLDLRGIEPFPIRDYDLMRWLYRSDPSWPIAKGSVWRQPGGRLRVLLDVESRLEWDYLQQHVPDDKVWKAINAWKKAMARDMEARLKLFKAIVDEIEKPIQEGGVGIEVIHGRRSDTESQLTSHYAFALYDQLFSRSLGLAHGPLQRSAFQMEDDRTVTRAGDPVVISEDEDVRSRAIDYLLRAQTELLNLPEVKVTADRYQIAGKKTKEVEEHLERIRLTLVFPVDSRCEICSSWP